jgi:transposase InsO family protein
VERFELSGLLGLGDRDRVAYRNANALDETQVDAVVALRRAYPTWGPKKLRARLVELGEVEVPSASTIGDVLKRNGLVRPRRRRPYASREFLGLTIGEQPNDVWCVDFKGDFRLGDKTRCYPLTISDFATRYLVDCSALASTKELPARSVFERVFREFGLPEIIRSDNGVPFASVGVGGLTSLVVWWIKLGIMPERIEPGHPEQNGRHERMHRTLKEEATRPPAANLAAQQRALDVFRHIYNDERPHEALGQKTPKSRYSVSHRRLPAIVEEVSYEEPLVGRRLDTSGRLSAFGTKVMITRLLANEQVGVHESEDAEGKAVHFGPLWLGDIRRKGKSVFLDQTPRVVRTAITL